MNGSVEQGSKKVVTLPPQVEEILAIAQEVKARYPDHFEAVFRAAVDVYIRVAELPARTVPPVHWG